jgi:hypothetical protein
MAAAVGAGEDTYTATFTKLPIGLGLNWDQDPEASDGTWYCYVTDIEQSAAEALAAGVGKQVHVINTKRSWKSSFSF